MSPYLFAIPVFFLLVAIEMYVAHRRGVQVYRFQDTLTSMNIGTMSQFVNTIGGAISVAMYAILVERFGAFTWDTSNPLTWVLALVLYDFFYYWVHRSGHEVNILWAAHSLGVLYASGLVGFSAQGVFDGGGD
jgi:sterol desaturase/sphingolipid hydroxylase (fatty acid hydroxylase superfamily)